MLDIKLIRTEPDKVKAAMRKRNKDMDAQVDEILAIDERRRQLSSESDNLKAQQNKASKEIPRIKIGVGAKPHPDYDMAAWVLSHFSKAELKVLEETTDRVAEAVKVILTEDIGQAMNRYNG